MREGNECGEYEIIANHGQAGEQLGHRFRQVVEDWIQDIALDAIRPECDQDASHEI